MDSIDESSETIIDGAEEVEEEQALPHDKEDEDEQNGFHSVYQKVVKNDLFDIAKSKSRVSCCHIRVLISI